MSDKDDKKQDKQDKVTKRRVRRAFVVAIDPEGQVMVTDDIETLVVKSGDEHIKLIPAGRCSADDFFNAANEIAEDMRTQKVAAAVIHHQMQMAASMAEQKQNQQILQKIQTP